MTYLMKACSTFHKIEAESESDSSKRGLWKLALSMLGESANIDADDDNYISTTTTQVEMRTNYIPSLLAV